MIVSVLFSLVFVAIGVGLLYGSSGAFVRGELTTGLGGLVSGGLFAGTGLHHAFRSIRGRRSREALAAGAETPVLGPPEYRAGRLSARQVYAAELASPSTLPVVADRPGSTLACELAVGEIGTRNDVAFALVWNAFAWPLFLLAFAHVKIGARIFLALFPLAGAFAALKLLRRWLARRRLPVVEIDAEPALLGAPLRVYLRQRGPARIVRLDARVVCTEHVAFMEGTDERHESNEVYAATLVEEVGIALRAGDEWTRLGVVELPAWPSSFAAAHNRVEWSVSVKAEIDGWPDYDEAFVFRAVPAPGGAA